MLLSKLKRRRLSRRSSPRGKPRHLTVTLGSPSPERPHQPSQFASQCAAARHVWVCFDWGPRLPILLALNTPRYYMILGWLFSGERTALTKGGILNLMAVLLRRGSEMERIIPPQMRLGNLLLDD